VVCYNGALKQVVGKARVYDELFIIDNVLFYIGLLNSDVQDCSRILDWSNGSKMRYYFLLPLLLTTSVAIAEVDRETLEVIQRLERRVDLLQRELDRERSRRSNQGGGSSEKDYEPLRSTVPVHRTTMHGTYKFYVSVAR
jgi:hypothetical protein